MNGDVAEVERAELAVEVTVTVNVPPAGAVCFQPRRFSTSVIV